MARKALGPASALVMAASITLLSTACGGGGGTPAPTTHAISGIVGGAVAAGVTIALSGAGSATTTTAANGTYAFSGLADGGYTLTPSLTGYTFSPASLSVTLAGADAAGRSFTATAIPPPTHAISGAVGGAATAGVTITLAGGASRTTTTGAGGAYAFTGLAAGAYTLTPSLSGHTFTPASRSVTLAAADLGGQDFTAAAVVAGTHTVSGTLTGAAVAGVKVTLSGAADATTTTDGAGSYAFTGLADGAYAVTPSAVGVLFAPQRRAAAVSGADLSLAAFAGTALQAYDDFSSGGLSTARWESGQRHVYGDGQAAFITAQVDGALPNTNHGAVLNLRPDLPEAPGAVTSARVAVSLDASAVTGDSLVRAGLDLIFQPAANRVAGPDNLTNALILRIALSDAAAGTTALRQVLACANPDCSSVVGVGTLLAGATWTAGLAVSKATSYTMSVAVDAVAKTVAFSIQGGALAGARAATLDLSGVTTPFPVDLTAANYFKLRLFGFPRGGAAGGGAGSLTARFDDLAIGTNGGALSLIEDFNTAPPLDPGRWAVRAEEVRVEASPAALVISQEQALHPGVVPLNLAASAAATTLQARVAVMSWAQGGPGQVGARIAGALYNDGSGGLGTPPDVPGASSQVGDVIAQISMTGTDVSYAVVRCNVAVCADATSADLSFLKERTSLGSVALGEEHVLRISWDDAAREVSFQLDDRPPVTFDPVAAGSPVAGPPGRPFMQVGTHAGAAGPGVDFSTASSGQIHAVLKDVRKL